MKRLFSLISITTILLAQFVPFISLAQTTATAQLADFEIVAPTEVNINEAFNITIRALGEDGKKLTTYEGMVYIDTDKIADVILPMVDGEVGYKFSLSDQGEHEIQKGITLKKAGEYNIDFLDLDVPPDGVIKSIKIVAVDKKPVDNAKADIIITEPASNDTVGTSSITVAGTSKATSSVNILLNGKKVATTQTDAAGSFSAPITGLNAGDNVIIAEVLSGTATVAGTSAPVTIKYSTEAPKLISLTIKEGSEFFAGSTINLTAVGDPNLKSVVIKVGDKTAQLTEDKTKLGTYTGVLKTSEFEGEFSAGALIESQLGTKVEIKDMAKFQTITAKIENIKVESTADKKVRFTFDLVPNLDQIQFFKIKYGTATKQYNKEVVTYQKDAIIEAGQFTWYIPDVPPGEYFSTIIALDKDKNETPVNSGEQTFLIKLDAAPVCFIDKVSSIQVKKFDGYSILSWGALPEASSYQIFKKDSSGEFVMIDEIEGTQIRININMDADEEIYEDFKVRALCQNGTYTGEGAYSDSVAVQTGPEMILFLALIMASGIAMILMRRGYL